MAAPKNESTLNSSGEVILSGSEVLAGATSEDQEVARFAQFYLESYRSLKAYLYPLLKDSAASEDCIQETALLLWDKRQPDWTLEDYRKMAFPTARFKALSWLKKNKYSSQKRLSPDLAEKISLLASESVTEKSYSDAQAERLSALRECISALPPKHRNVIDARYQSNHAEALKEISNKQKLSMAAAYKQIERIRTKLRKCIQLKLTKNPPS